MVVRNQSWMGVAGCVDLTTPLGHEMPKSSIAWARLWERPCVSISSKMSLSFLSFWVFYAYLCMVAMPTGYKLVISCALRVHGTYCPQSSGARSSGFGAIKAIHPSLPWYNRLYNVKGRLEEINVLKQETTNSWHSLQPENVTPSWRGTCANNTRSASSKSSGPANTTGLVNREKVQLQLLQYNIFIIIIAIIAHAFCNTLHHFLAMPFM